MIPVPLRFNQDCSRLRHPRGMTLVEVLLALLLLTVGVLGLLTLLGGSIRQLRMARRQTVMAAVAQRRLDSLAALPCATLATNPSGAPQAFEQLSDSWTVTGSPDAPTVTVRVSTPDASTPTNYTTAVPCR